MRAWIHQQVWRADYCMFWLIKRLLTAIAYPFALLHCMWRERDFSIGRIPLYHGPVMHCLTEMAIAEWSVADYWSVFNDKASHTFCSIFWSCVLVFGALSYAVLYHMLFGA